MDEKNNFTERIIKCPQCGRSTIYSLKNQSRPFCSDRCKLIDLGDWASEKFKIESKNDSSNALTEDDFEANPH